MRRTQVLRLTRPLWLGGFLALAVGCGGGDSDVFTAAPIPSIVPTTAPSPTEAPPTTSEEPSQTTSTSSAATSTSATNSTTVPSDALAFSEGEGNSSASDSDSIPNSGSDENSDAGEADAATIGSTDSAVEPTAPTTVVPVAPDVTIDVSAAHVESNRPVDLPYIDGQSNTTIARLALACGETGLTLAVILVSENDVSTAEQRFSFFGPSGTEYSLFGIVESGKSVTFGSGQGNVPAVGSYDEWAICSSGEWLVAGDLADNTGPTMSVLASVVVSL